MNHLNKTIIQGNLTRDPEYKEIGSSEHGNSQTQVSHLCNFTVASNRKYKDKEEATFVEVTAWGKLAEICCKYLAKGKPVLVEGRLQLNSWTTDGGEKRSKLVIIANEVIFLHSNDKKPENNNSAPVNTTPVQNNTFKTSNDLEDLPF